MRKPDGTSIDRVTEVPDLNAEEINIITQLCFYAPRPQKADAMLVFGAPEGDWSPAAQVYKAGLVELIITSGGVHERTNGTTEAHLIKADLIKQGVPESKIIEDGKAENTLQNVQNFKKIVESNAIHPKSIIYLTLRHVSGRCYLTLKKYFPDTTISATTHGLLFSGLNIYAKNWYKDPKSASRVYGEYLRIMAYSERGDIAPISYILSE